MTSASFNTAEKQDPVQKQVRGSTLLVAGRFCSMLLNLITQIVMIRMLVKSEYGMLAYVLSIVDLMSITAVLCMDKTFSRFGAIYQQQHDRARFTGALILGLTIPLFLGVSMILLVLTSRLVSPNLIPFDGNTVSLFLILVLLIPSNGIASVSLSMLTVLKGARSVFFRKHLLGPILKLSMILSVAVQGGGVWELAMALLITGVIVLAIDLYLVVQVFVKQRDLCETSYSRIIFPTRDLVTYSLPNLMSDFAYQARGAMLIVLLGWLATSEQTASYRASMSLLKVNELIATNFMVLFIPIASRLFSANQFDELRNMYLKTNLWIMMLSFPLFAGTVMVAHPAVHLMFGSAYADASLLLIITSFALYVQTTFGMNGLLLRVMGRMKVVLAAELIAAVVTLVTAFLLIRQWGALGAAITFGLGILMQCVLKSLALHRILPMSISREHTLSKYALVAIAYCLTMLAILVPLGIISGIVISILSTVLAFLVMHPQLQTADQFPELLKIPGLKTLLTYSSRATSTTDEAENNSSPRIAYLMSRFPKLTETFVFREILEMERLGAEVEIYPLQREQVSVIHEEVEPLVNRAQFTPWMSGPILLANLRTFCHQPVRYVSTLRTLFRANWGSKRYLSGAMLFFPKAVYLSEKMQRDRIEFIHAHFASHPAMVAWTIHQLTGLPYSFTAHGSDLHRDRHMLVEKVRDASAVVTISEYNRHLILAECPTTPQEHIHVIHCGIDVASFPKRIESTSYDAGQGPFQLICIGTLHEVKGQAYLIEACAKLQTDGMELICHLVGDGPDREKLTALCDELNIRDQVKFHGRKTSSEIRSLINNIDLIVAPSVPTSDGRREGIPVVLMEGMGSGLPAVASDLSGIPEIVQHQQTGLLAAPRESQQLAEAILLMACDPYLRTTYAQAGYELVQLEFHLSKNTAILYRMILKHLGRAEPEVFETTAEDESLIDEKQEASCPV